MMSELVVDIVLVGGHTTHYCLDPQSPLQCLHCTFDVWMVRRKHAELEEATETAIKRRILLDMPILVHIDHAQEMTKLFIPQIAQRSIFDLSSGLLILGRHFLLTKELRKPDSCIQTSIDCRSRKCQDTPALLPQIVGRTGQACEWITVKYQEIGSRCNERLDVPSDK